MASSGGIENHSGLLRRPKAKSETFFVSLVSWSQGHPAAGCRLQGQVSDKLQAIVYYLTILLIHCVFSIFFHLSIVYLFMVVAPTP